MALIIPLIAKYPSPKIIRTPTIVVKIFSLMIIMICLLLEVWSKWAGASHDWGS
jgi:hypothetical protein